MCGLYNFLLRWVSELVILNACKFVISLADILSLFGRLLDV